MDKFSALRAFASVAEAGGFSSASRRMGLATSSVVRAVDGLEDALGAVLLNRTTRRVTLTDAGIYYYQKAKKLLEDLADADSQVSDRGEEPSGPLRVSVPVAYGTRCIAPHVGAFLDQFPKLDLDMRLTDDAVDLVRERIDVAIRFGEASPTADVVARELGVFRRYVVASRAYLAEYGTPRSPDELSNHRCVRFSYGVDQQFWSFSGLGEPVRVVVTGKMKSNNSEVLRATALDGSGIALLPDWLVDADIRSGNLLRLFESYEVAPNNERSVVSALYLPNQRGSKRVGAFVELVSSLLSRTR